MDWNKTYTRDKKIWGEKPGELAVFALNYLKESSWFRGNPDIFILDVGCGYGRDAVFLARNLPCHILGVDISEKAIQMARQSLPRDLENKIEFLCYDFNRLVDKYDVILASNLYQILQPDERMQLRETIKRCLKADGILFLSSLSVRDPQHIRSGTPVKDEPNTFVDEKYIHLCTREELEEDFNFLNISALFEREFIERRSILDHHHVSWILMGIPL